MYSLEQSKVRPGNCCGFGYPDTDYLSIPSFQVASCCLYLYCFPPPKRCMMYFPKNISAPTKLLYFTTPSQKCLLLLMLTIKEIMFLIFSLKFQYFSLWILYHHHIVGEKSWVKNADFRIL